MQVRQRQCPHRPVKLPEEDDVAMCGRSSHHCGRIRPGGEVVSGSSGN